MNNIINFSENTHFNDNKTQPRFETSSASEPKNGNHPLNNVSATWLDDCQSPDESCNVTLENTRLHSVNGGWDKGGAKNGAIAHKLSDQIRQEICLGSTELTSSVIWA